MSRSRVIRGQRVDDGKVHQARELRNRPTSQEALLWERLRANRIDGLHFRRQQIIDGFIADFYCHAVGLVIELDGAGHIGQVDYDAERDAIIAARGLRILRISNDELEADVDGVLERIRYACRVNT